MNKLLSTLALAGLTGTAFAAGNVDGLTVKAKVDFESQYIVRGKEHSDKNLQTKVVAEYALPAADAAIYGGVFMMSPIEQAANELVTFLGAKTEYEKFVFEAGYSHYARPNRALTRVTTPGGAADIGNNDFAYSDSNEVSIGTSYLGMRDVFTPSAYIHYNFDLKQTTYEAALRRSFNGDDFGAAGFEVIVAGFAGYVQADRANGDQRTRGVTIADFKNDYGYLGASVDVAYAVSNTAKVGAGARYAWNSDGNEDSLGRLNGNTDENFWYGLWAEFKY